MAELPKQTELRKFVINNNKGKERNGRDKNNTEQAKNICIGKATVISKNFHKSRTGVDTQERIRIKEGSIVVSRDRDRVR